MPLRIERQAEPIPGYRLIERLGGGGFGEVWKAKRPAACSRPSSSSTATCRPPTTQDGSIRAEQELKALSRVKTVHHPYILSLERFDIIDGQLIIVMELADRNLWDRFRECRDPGPARHSARGAARLHGGDGRGARPDEQPVPAAAPRHQAAEPVPGLSTTSRSPTSAWSRTWKATPAIGHRRRHAGLRRPGDVRRLGQPLQRPVQPGHRLSRSCSPASGPSPAATSAS